MRHPLPPGQGSNPPSVRPGGGPGTHPLPCGALLHVKHFTQLNPPGQITGPRDCSKTGGGKGGKAHPRWLWLGPGGGFQEKPLQAYISDRFAHPKWNSHGRVEFPAGRNDGAWVPKPGPPSPGPGSSAGSGERGLTELFGREKCGSHPGKRWPGDLDFSSLLRMPPPSLAVFRGDRPDQDGRCMRRTPAGRWALYGSHRMTAGGPGIDARRPTGRPAHLPTAHRPTCPSAYLPTCPSANLPIRQLPICRILEHRASVEVPFPLSISLLTSRTALLTNSSPWGIVSWGPWVSPPSGMGAYFPSEATCGPLAYPKSDKWSALHPLCLVLYSAKPSPGRPARGGYRGRRASGNPSQATVPHRPLRHPAFTRQGRNG
ncbi:hypothetical protein HRbin11_01475 [bacterium HR11]|nr:hypothetical protein HRbin11_01475 [bacterium HR11]